METAKKPGIFALGPKGWGISAFGLLFYFLWQGPLYGGSNFWFTALNEMYGWQTPEMALPITLAGILSMFGIILWGAICKKIGAKKVIIISLALGALTNLFFAFIPELWAFSASVILYFFCAVGYSIIGVGQLGADWFPHKKGVYMGIVTAGASMQAALIPLALTALIPAFGVTGAMLLFTVAQLIIAGLTALVVKNTPEEAGAYPDNDRSASREQVQKEAEKMEEYKRNSPWTLKALLTCPTVWKISLGWGICMFCNVGIIQQLVQIYISFGYDMMFGIAVLSVWPVGLLAHVGVGVIDQKLGTKITSILCGCLLVCAIAIVVFIGPSQPIAAGAGGLLLLVGASGIMNVVMSMTATVFGRKDFGNAWPVISTIYQLVSNAGVLIVSLLAAAISYQFTLMACIGIVAVGIIVMFTTPKSLIDPPKGSISKSQVQN